MLEEFDAKWMVLRTRFIARLPERVADIEHHGADCAGADSRDALTALFHIVHSLAGSAATFGFDGIAQAAHEAETNIESAMKSATPHAAATAQMIDATAQMIDSTSQMTDTLKKLIDVVESVFETAARGEHP